MRPPSLLVMLSRLACLLSFPGLLQCEAEVLAEETQSEVLAEAYEELQVGAYGNSEKWFKKWFEQSELPADQQVRAFLGLSRVHAEQGRYAEGIASLKQAIESLPNHSPLHARLAEFYYLIGDYTRAEREVRQALELNSQDLRAQLIQAHLLTEAGKIEEATANYRAFIRTYNRLQPTDWETLLLIGEGAAVYARWESVPQVFRFVVNTLCPDALKDHPQCWQAHLLGGELLLEKYNPGQALPEFQSALEINPHAADALLAMAGAAFQKSNYELASQFIERTLKINPQHTKALQLRAFTALLLEQNEAAHAAALAAQHVNSRDQATLGILAALDILQRGPLSRADCQAILDGSYDQPPEPESFHEIWRTLLRGNPRPGRFLETVAALLEMRRHYDLAECFYLKSFELMPQLSGPKTSLGMLYMRTGNLTEAERLLNAAFESDPFHVRVSNMRKVIGVLKSYITVESPHFVIYAASTDELLARMVSDYLEEIYPELTERYDYEPETRTQVEIYSATKDQAGHAWFSARMIGLPWIQTIGASTGKIVAVTSPSETEQNYHWMRVLRHEFMHVLTLQKTGFQIPHWFTEALAVWEESQRVPVAWEVLLQERAAAQTLFDLANINAGFQRPQSGDDWTLAYCQSFLYADYFEERFGPGALLKLLDAYCRTSQTSEAVQLAFQVDIAELEAGYRERIVRRVESTRRQLGPRYPDVRGAQKLVADEPENAQAHAFLARALLAGLGFAPPVREATQSSLKLDPAEPLANALHAADLLAQGEAAQAVEIMEALDGAGSEHPLCLQVHAAGLQAIGKLTEAEELLRLAINRFPLVIRFQGQLLKLLDEHAPENEEIPEILLRLAAADENDIPTRKRLARFYADQGNLSQALHWTYEALAVVARDPQMHRLLVDVLKRSQQSPQALRACERLLLLDQSDSSDQVRYATLLIDNERKADALQVLNKVLESDPDYQPARELLRSLNGS